jgi:hypothetical protein
MLPDIPPDHLIDPRLGKVGFFGPPTPYGPPESWERQHRLGQAGGYFRIGRQWTRLPDEDRGAALRLVGMPFWMLYHPLLGRIGQANALAQGYTVDA